MAKGTRTDNQRLSILKDVKHTKGNTWKQHSMLDSETKIFKSPLLRRLIAEREERWGSDFLLDVCLRNALKEGGSKLRLKEGMQMKYNKNRLSIFTTWEWHCKPDSYCLQSAWYFSFAHIKKLRRSQSSLVWCSWVPPEIPAGYFHFSFSSSFGHDLHTFYAQHAPAVSPTISMVHIKDRQKVR